MSRTFYGNFLRERFPYKGKIRSEEDSVGARLLNALGSEIERSYRSKVFGSTCLAFTSSEHAIRDLGTLYSYDMTEYSDYNQNVLSERIKDYSVEGFDRTKSLEELFNSLPSSFKYDTTADRVSNNPLLFSDIAREVAGETLLEESSYIYINVKEITDVFQRVLNERSGVTLRGYDNNMMPIEEFIPVNSSKMYRSKNKFLILDKLVHDPIRGIAGGNAISVSSLKTFKIDILKENCKSWVSRADYTFLDDNEAPLDTKVKRIELPGLLSKPKLSRIFFNNSVTDNTLLLEVCVFTYDGETRTKAKFAHRFFNEIDEYVKETNSLVLEEGIFEHVIGEVEFLDASSNPVEIVDFDFDIKTNSLFALTTTRDLLVYDVGMPLCEGFEILRTFNPGMRIDLLDNEYLKGESLSVRLINSSLDTPLSNFIVGKKEDGQISFLSEDKQSFGQTPGVFNAIFADDDLQNTIGKFTFDLSVNESDIELFVLCFKNNQKNSQALLEVSANDSLEVTEMLNAFDIEHLNVRKIIRSLAVASKAYPNIVNTDNIKNIYLKGVESCLWFVDETNNHYKFTPEYNKAFFENHTIYTTEEARASFTVNFTLFNGETKGVAVDA